MLTIENNTRYDTRTLKALVRACERHLGLTWSRRVIFKVSRKNRHWGHATYPHNQKEGTWVEFFIPADPAHFNFFEFAWLVEHELLHNQGVRHGDMTNAQRYCNVEMPPKWAESFRERGVLFHTRATKTVTPEERVAARAAHVDEKVAYWQRKAKLAKTKLAHYLRKQRYYQKRAAVPPHAEEGPTLTPPPQTV